MNKFIALFFFIVFSSHAFSCDKTNVDVGLKVVYESDTNKEVEISLPVTFNELALSNLTYVRGNAEIPMAIFREEGKALSYLKGGNSLFKNAKLQITYKPQPNENGSISLCSHFQTVELKT
ncbi:MAG: hypothetical protein K6L73_02035 [Cellvibrionaceae bacterium]